MQRPVRVPLTPLLCLVLACGPEKSDSAGSTADTGGASTDGPAATTGDPVDRGDCDAFLDCIATVDPQQASSAADAYGPMSACWTSSAAVAQGCREACTGSLKALAAAYPDEPACGGTGSPTSGTTAPTTGDDPADQTPPQGHDAIEAWLAEGHYKAWTCQPTPHAPIPISPHGVQRICANDLLSTHPPDSGEYPVGSASVKELYDNGGATIVGYAVSVHTKAGTDGSSWYWYERVPLDSPAPHDDNGVVADGHGDSGLAMSICVGCHSATGIDADHPGHDFVYVQVQ